MILTDGVHLVSDTSLDELHAFAASIGLKREWFQCPPKASSPHYDLTTKRATQRAIKAGASLVGAREIVAAIRKLRETK